ncbi:MAG: hypothetical protein ABFC77_06710 [Thermoguttaceae bacterium]
MPIDQPSIPTPEEVGDGIVRMNSGNDSNNQRELVIETAARYKHAFFNTSLPTFDFPRPVVWTANPCEEQPVRIPPALATSTPKNLMFVRLRVSSTNLRHIKLAADWFAMKHIPVVLTFMAYYEAEPQPPTDVLAAVGGPCYEWRVRHINSYHCPTAAFIRYVLGMFDGNRLVSYCGAFDNEGNCTPYCQFCRNCETFYYQSIKRMRGE